MKEKYREKKQKLKELECPEEETQDKVELEEGSGCFIDKAKFDNISVMSKTSTIMALALFKECFGKEYIATHSLYGKSDLPEAREILFSVRNALLLVINDYY
jgi:hypothetical protein